jgi:hypothetical protein
MVVDDITVKRKVFEMRDLMRKILDSNTPVELPSCRYSVDAPRFARTIRASPAARATFDLDLVTNTVDFASESHRTTVAELRAAGNL